MKNRHLIFLIVLYTILGTGCIQIVKVIHGAHQPRQEKVESIRQFAQKKGIQIDGTAMIAEDSILYSFVKRLNEAVLFDKNGYQIRYNQNFENPNCGGNIENFLAGLDTITYATRDSGNTIHNEAGMWVKFGSKEAYDFEFNPSKYDYYLAYYWNTFSGNPNHRDAIKNLQQAINLNKRISVQMILVNQDIRNGIDEQKFVQTARRYGFDAEVK